MKRIEALDDTLLHSGGKPLTGLQDKILSDALRRLEMSDQIVQEAVQAKSAIDRCGVRTRGSRRQLRNLALVARLGAASLC